MSSLGSWYSARRDVRADPLGKLDLIDATRRDIEHEADNLALIRCEPMAVETEEHVHNLRRSAFVANDERVVLGDAYTVGGRAGGVVSGGIIGPPL